MCRAVFLGDGRHRCRATGHGADRLLNHRRRYGSRGPRRRRRARLCHAGCAGLGRRRRRRCRDADLHVRWRQGGVRRRRCRCCRKWARTSCIAAAPAYGQVTKICNNMVAGHHRARDRRGIRHGREAGCLPPDALRRDVDLVRQFVHPEQDVPDARPGAGLCLPSNGFKPGFTAKLMLKDALRLSQAAAQMAGTATPLGAVATAAFAMHVANGFGDLDMSSIVSSSTRKSKSPRFASASGSRWSGMFHRVAIPPRARCFARDLPKPVPLLVTRATLCSPAGP